MKCFVQADLYEMFCAGGSVWTVLCRLICMDCFLQADLYEMFCAG